MKNKFALIILGKPSSGKDTQADLLAKKYGLVRIKTSDILKKIFRTKSNFIRLGSKKFNLEKERWLNENGFLNSTKFVTELIKEHLLKIAKAHKGVAFSGSPRIVYELNNELPLLDKIYSPKRTLFFYLDLPDKEAIKRATLRGRADDSVIKRRLKVFRKETWPVVIKLKKIKRIFFVNGKPPIKPIFKNLAKIIDKKLNLGK